MRGSAREDMDSGEEFDGEANEDEVESVETADDDPRFRPKRRLPVLVRAQTINVTRLPQREIEMGRLSYPEAVERPFQFGECHNAYRKPGDPCAFVGCQHHTYLDVDEENGSIKINFPDLEPENMANPCVLELVNQYGDMTLEDVGEMINLTRERVRQIEDNACAVLRREIKAVYRLEASEEPAHTAHVLADHARF